MTPDRRRSKLSGLHDVGETLRQSVDAPDFTNLILSRVHEERPFLQARARRWVLVSRAAVGVSVLTVLLGVALVQRYGGDSVRVVNGPAPLCDVVRCVECETVAGLGSIRETVWQFADVRPEEFISAVSTAAATAPVPEARSLAACGRCEQFVGPAIPMSVAVRVQSGAGNTRCDEARLALARLKTAQPAQSPWPRAVLGDFVDGLHFGDAPAAERVLSPDEGAFPK